MNPIKDSPGLCISLVVVPGTTNTTTWDMPISGENAVIGIGKQGP